MVGHQLRDPIHELTAGWPAAVQLTAEMLQSVPEDERTRTLAELGRSGDRLGSYLAREVLEREPGDVRELLRIAAEFDRFSPELCQAVGASPPAELRGRAPATRIGRGARRPRRLADPPRRAARFSS